MNQQQLLEEVRAGLRSLPAREREEELAEMQAHLAASRDAARELGYGEQEAEAEAVRQFGSARKVTRQLRAARRRRTRMGHGSLWGTTATVTLLNALYVYGVIWLIEARRGDRQDSAEWLALCGTVSTITHLIGPVSSFVIGFVWPRAAPLAVTLAAIFYLPLIALFMPGTVNWSQAFSFGNLSLDLLTATLPAACGVFAAHLQYRHHLTRA